MGCRDRQPVAGGNRNPERGRQHGSDEAVLQLAGEACHLFLGNNKHSLAYRVGYGVSSEEGTAELEDRSDDYGIAQGQRPAPDAGAHGIGDVVGTNVPRHVRRYGNGEQYHQFEHRPPLGRGLNKY